MTPRLFENRVGKNYIGTRGSDNNDFTHCSSVVVEAMARYLASMEDRATIRCFVELQKIGLTPRNMRKTPIEVRSSGYQPVRIRDALEKSCNV